MNHKETVYPLILFTVFVICSYIDSFYTYPKMINSTKISEYQCKNYPEKCWIKENKHAD